MRFSVAPAIFFCSFFPDCGAKRRASSAPETAPMPNPTATLPMGNFCLLENIKNSFQRNQTRERDQKGWLRGVDLNHRPLGYEPNELPDCSTPRHRPLLLKGGRLSSDDDSPVKDP